MNVSRLDLPIAPATDVLGAAIDAASTSAGAIADTAAALSDQVATHVAHVAGKTSRHVASTFDISSSAPPWSERSSLRS
jgi:hypothetical protein